MPAAYFLLIQREYGTTPARRRALSEGTGVREGALTEPGAEITVGQLRRQIENANRLLEPGWELPMASQLHASAHGAVGFAAVSAPTLRQSFEVVARFGHVRAPFHRVRVSAEKQGTVSSSKSAPDWRRRVEGASQPGGAQRAGPRRVRPLAADDGGEVRACTRRPRRGAVR
jgi:hypothetical protein